MAWTWYIHSSKKVLLTSRQTAWFQSQKSRVISHWTTPSVIASKFTVKGALEGIKSLFIYIPKLLWFALHASPIPLLPVSFWSGFLMNKQLSIQLSHFDIITFHKSSTIPMGFQTPSQSISESHTSQTPSPSVSFWLGL